MAYSYNEVLKKKQEYEEAAANKPSEFKSSFAALRDEVLEKIAAREEFSYSPYSDPLYNHYKNIYKERGDKALRDTLASASALSGGALNSYAITAANQKYSDILSKGDEIIPELYEAAMNRYNSSKTADEKLLSYYNSLVEMEEDEYQKEWDRYFKELSSKEDAYKTAENSYSDSVKKQNNEDDKKDVEITAKNENVRSFKKALMTNSEFAASVYSRYYKTYADYIRVTLNSWTNNKMLTPEEKMYLKELYGV